MSAWVWCLSIIPLFPFDPLLEAGTFGRKSWIVGRRKPPVEFRLQKLGPNFKKSYEPACANCGYEADWLVGIYEEIDGVNKKIERTFCERDMRDALLDTFNFNTLVPDSFLL